MSFRLESISGLRAFIAAADKRSFKAAGKLIGISSSAVGKAVARLESQLAVQLFHRTTRTITLTEGGALFLLRARRVVDELEAAESEPAHKSDIPRGRLRVSLPLTGSILNRPLVEFATTYPLIEVDLDFSDRLVDVIDEGFDVVIRTGEPADNRLMHRRLGRFNWRLAASPVYLRRMGAPRDTSDLGRHACLRQRFSNGRVAPWQFHSGPDVHVPVTLVANIIDPLLELAIEGGGIGAFPEFMIMEYLEDGRLEEVLGGRLSRDGELHILWPATRYQTPKTRLFVDFMRKWSQNCSGLA